MNLKKKRSLLERLTGTIRLSDDRFNVDEDDDELKSPFDELEEDSNERDLMAIEENGELSVDVFQNSNEIIIKAMVAGVKPEDLDVEISRDMVTIKGSRREENEVSRENYYHKELFWGSFARSISLSEEIDVDSSKASTKNGMLTLRLPKVDKKRRAKLNIKPE